MGFIKCPRCELNYIKETEDYCDVCRREMRGKFLQDDREEDEENFDLCAECNERPALPGEELCLICKRESMQEDEEEPEDIPEDPLVISEVSEMDEIRIDVEEVPPEMEEDMDKELED